jgi:hypothetical protein
MCGRKHAPYENLKSVTNWTSEEYRVVTSGTKQLFIEAVVKQLGRNEVHLCLMKILKQTGWLSGSFIVNSKTVKLSF